MKKKQNNEKEAIVIAIVGLFITLLAISVYSMDSSTGFAAAGGSCAELGQQLTSGSELFVCEQGATGNVWVKHNCNADETTEQCIDENYPDIIRLCETTQIDD